MVGTLFLVATPIGNLEDITLRAIRILKEVDFIAAEDTRHSLKLLNHLGISKPLISYYKQKEASKSSYLVDELLSGKNIALISDAGTPVISDPGETVVSLAIENGIPVVPVPGPCAIISALIASGISATSFSFFGFLPVSKKEKFEKLEAIKNYETTLVFYEAPHKLTATLEAMLEVLGDRSIVLCRELTKVHEEFIRGKLSDVLTKLSEPKGEFVLIVEGNLHKKEESIAILNNLSLEEHYKFYENQGFSKKEIIKKIAKDRGVAKNEIYQHFVID